MVGGGATAAAEEAGSAGMVTCLRPQRAKYCTTRDCSSCSRKSPNRCVLVLRRCKGKESTCVRAVVFFYVILLRSRWQDA